MSVPVSVPVRAASNRRLVKIIIQDLRSQELQKLKEFRRKAPNRPSTQRSGTPSQKPLSMYCRLTRDCLAGEGDVGEASRFASSVRNEQSETPRLHIEPLYGWACIAHKSNANGTRSLLALTLPAPVWVS